MMIQLLQRQVIKFRGTHYRVLLIEQHRSAAWLFNLQQPGWPVQHQLSTLAGDTEASEGAELSDKWHAQKIDMTEAERTRAKRNFEIIGPLIGIDAPSELFYSGIRCEALERQAKAHDTTRQTVTTLVRKYWSGGMTLFALVPSFGLRGGAGKKRYDALKPLGRPRTFDPQPKIIVDATLSKLFDKAIKRYETNKPIKFVDAYDDLIQGHFTELQYSSEGIPEPRLKIPYPSLKQLRYYYVSSTPASLRAEAKMRQREFELKFRSICGRADQKVLGPGHRFQIDATIWDVYLRSALDRNRIVGRPTVYLIVDEFSRLIVGFYIGFESASWAAASLALINMVTPKVEFCRSIGISIVEEDWPAAVAPSRLLADRGELLSLSVGDKLEALNITIDNTPPYRGDRKPIVESDFRTIPAIFKKFVPGVVEKDWGERGADDPRIKSAMTLGPFTKMLVLAILQHNRTPISGYVPIPEMVTAGLTASPNNLWKWGIGYRAGEAKAVSVDAMSLAVLHEGEARITARGISFAGQHYSCPTGVARGWFTRVEASKKCKIRFDSMNLNTIVVLHKDFDQGFEVAHRIGLHAALVSEFSMAEFQDVANENKHLLGAEKSGLLVKKIADNISFANLVDRDAQDTSDVTDPNASKRSLIRDIRSNKASEKAAARAAQGLMQSSPMASSQSKRDLIDEKEDEYADFLSQSDEA